MRITAIIDSLNGGGAERTLLTLAKGLKEKGHALTIITFKGVQIATQSLGGCSHISLERGGSAKRLSLARLITLIPLLRRVIIDSRPDRIISFMDQANILTAISLMGNSTPLLVSERVYPAYSSLLTLSNNPIIKGCFRLLRNIAYLNASTVILQSERMKDYFPRILQKKLLVIPNPIVAPESAGVAPNLGPYAIVSIGRLVEQKRFDLLITAFSGLREKFPEWQVYIAGDGPSKRELLALSESLNMKDRVHFLGRQTDIQGILKQATIFTLTSDFEGFPVALGEALFCSVPTIASDCLTGPRELLGASEFGLLFPQGDAEKLAQLLSKLMADSDLRATYSHRGNKRAEDFGLERILLLWQNALNLANKTR